MKLKYLILGLLLIALSCSEWQTKPESLVRFQEPWTSPFQVDSLQPYQLVNREGKHLLILNKTAWAYFGMNDPEGFLKRSKAQGVNVIRVAFVGAPYFEDLHIELWPWEGSIENPDFSGYDESYWDEVEKRIKMAGEYGIGIDFNIYNTVREEAHKYPEQNKFWKIILDRFGKYSNILTWEIMNEYLGNQKFQDSVGSFFYENDKWNRPVITSDGTTDDAAWPDKEWMGMSVVHTCTGSGPKHDLKDWYLAVARNSRAHGKPAFNNESGREKRHKNDDPEHRRKQSWIWYAAGCHWTWHSWEGCEGIEDPKYRGPGAQYLKPVTEFFRSLPFWKMNPNFTILNTTSLDWFSVILADSQRKNSIVYICTTETGKSIPESPIKLRLPDGIYNIEFIDPATLKTLKSISLTSQNLGFLKTVTLPGFTDDIVLKIKLVETRERSMIKGTE
tara:strand:- start:14254 stop:15591 length:1338 start_codon:yes stop_codon:yes gene_type:complete